MTLFSQIFGNKQDWQSAPRASEGLTKFIVANDLHIGSEYQDNHNAFACLSALYKYQFDRAHLSITHVLEIDEENETIWVKKK